MRKYVILILTGMVLIILLSIMTLKPTKISEGEKIIEDDVIEKEDVKEAEILESTNLIGQREFIGRQPPVDYIEPVGSDRFEFQLEFKDTYQSNIVVIAEEIWGMNFERYNWFYPLNNHGKWHEIHQFICYAILTYYNNAVPYDYYVNLDDDIHNGHEISSMIFEVQTHSEKPLNICLDMYNYRIYVEEGIKQKNPECKQGCCD